MTELTPDEFVDRESFVAREVIQFSEARDYGRPPILVPLIEYILDNMLEPDERWETELRSNPDWFDLQAVRHTLVLSLQDIDRLKPLIDLEADDLPTLVMKSFERRVHRWGSCASPWIIC